ncbi:hypothetical protein [Bradyrhizobium sp. 199]|uniref:hypothetical protein n=1 Tax=Bradyrhizobium sp. 199 TaxID=2782664 RepID=UPI001FFA6045|nr:hypothetical protein [Bradyrhizobium sp. 199]MCK1359011.1 hypothetical protein [Bradyrhizobium sp. 199]
MQRFLRNPPMQAPERASGASVSRLTLGLLIFVHIAMCCVSLVFVLQHYGRMLPIAANSFPRLEAAALAVIPFALCAIVFAFRRFSFGYAVSFYFFSLILGYLRLIEFSTFQYDHRTAAISAFASGIAFLIPALFLTSPFPRTFELSAKQLTVLLWAILLESVAILVVGSVFSFQLVSPSEIYNFRNDIALPRWLNYAVLISSSSLLPFAYACFIRLRSYRRAALCLLLLLLFYPVTLTKLSLLAPGWLLFLTVLSRYFDGRTATILSLLLPILAGVLITAGETYGLLPNQLSAPYFGTVNFRMIAMPSSALDFYNDFFASHELTHFCQITFVKSLMSCPYKDPLSVVMQDSYHIGYFNASLFATEGIASVGPRLAPFSAFACGLVIGLGNRASSGLPEQFILLSGGLLLQVLLNVPLTIVVVSHGAAMMFLLWYVTPRDVLDQPPTHLLQGASSRKL